MTGVRLTLLLLEGYLYLALIVATFLGPVAFLIWGLVARRPFVAMAAILVGVPVVRTAWRALRALWLAFPEVSGVDVGPRFGARLHQEVRVLAGRLGARVHRIVVTGTCNAAVVQTPLRWRLRPTNTLLLGYPLLATLSADQFRAVIAHELAHLTRAYGRFARWVYRNRTMWIRLLDVLQRHASTPAHVYALFRFYVPRLDRYAAEVSRQHERVADRLAADVTGAGSAAQALVAIDVGSYVFDQVFWPQIFERVAQTSDPPNPFVEMGPDVWTEVTNRNEIFQRLLTARTEALHSHPALSERLAAIDREAHWPQRPSATAVDEFFGSEKHALTSALGQEWRAEHEAEWRERHETIRARRVRLAQLEDLVSPTVEQTFERGMLIEEDGRETDALAVFLSAHRLGHAAAGLAAGRLLLDRDDASGIALIDTAMDTDPSLIESGCRTAMDFLEGRGQFVDAHAYQRRRARQATTATLAHRELAALSVVDRFRPCADPAVDRGRILRAVQAEPGVSRVFLVMRDLRHSSGTQTVLGIVVDHGAADLNERLGRDGAVPPHAVVHTLGRQDAQVEAALREVPGALVYDADLSAEDHSRSAS